MTRYSGKLPRKPLLGTSFRNLSYRIFSLSYIAGAFLVYETNLLVFIIWIILGLVLFETSMEK